MNVFFVSTYKHRGHGMFKVLKALQCQLKKPRILIFRGQSQELEGGGKDNINKLFLSTL